MSGPRKYLGIESLGRLSVVLLVSVSIISIAAAAIWVRDINRLNETWRQHEEGVSKKAILLDLTRGALGYGGMIHNLKNFILRGERSRLLSAHRSMLDLKITIASYRQLGISETEKEALVVFEETMRKYQSALVQAEILAHRGLSIAAIDAAVMIEDGATIEALKRLDSEVVKTRLINVEEIEAEVEDLTRLASISAAVIGVLLVIVTVGLGWFVRRRLVAPIGELVRAFEAIDPAVTTTRRLPERQGQWRDELDLLAQSGNRYLEAVSDHMKERQQAEERLRQSEQRFDTSQRFANIGTWDWNIQTGDLHWSERIAPLFGYQVGEVEQRYENFIAAIHPDDRQAVQDAISGCVESGTEYNIEHRVVWADGTLRWLHETGDVVRDEAGRPLNMLGVVRDITWRKQAEKRLRQSEAQLSAAIENIGDGFILIDADSRIVLFNERFRRLYPNSFDLIGKGMPYENFLLGGAERGEYPDAVGRIDDWLASRRSRRDMLKAGGSASFEQRLIGDRWVRVAMSLLPDGGLVAVHVDISEIRQAHEEADLANRAKSEFLSAMSHDLRTPLNSILGFSQVLRSDPEAPLNEDQEDSVEHIAKAGNHLLGLINEVLDLTRIESGNISLSPEAVMPRDLVGECLDLIRPLAEDRGVVVNADFDEELPAVEVDYARLKDVLLNLLSNAVKYNRGQGTVAVSCRPALGQRLRLSVADSGPGIPEERLPELFLPFSRLGAESSEIEGTGIGLTIAKRLVELMHGEIGVESAVGKGSVFWIELPLAPQTPLAAELGDASDHRSEAGTAPLAFGAASHTVLYVEDNPANLHLMRKLIARRPNCTLIEAASGEAGLDLVASGRPDIVIMDINLPGIDGFEALRRLRQSEGGGEVPVIALSANAMPEIVKQGLAAGFFAYLTKPVDVPSLMQALDAVLGDKS